MGNAGYGKHYQFTRNQTISFSLTFVYFAYACSFTCSFALLAINRIVSRMYIYIYIGIMNQTVRNKKRICYVRFYDILAFREPFRSIFFIENAPYSCAFQAVIFDEGRVNELARAKRQTGCSIGSNSIHINCILRKSISSMHV